VDDKRAMKITPANLSWRGSRGAFFIPDGFDIVSNCPQCSTPAWADRIENPVFNALSNNHPCEVKFFCFEPLQGADPALELSCDTEWKEEIVLKLSITTKEDE